MVHFHAIIRLDGADGPDQSPPDWADHHLLARAVPVAARSVKLLSPASELGPVDARVG
ncbi:replication initiator [Nonomuraea dietziae]|uniref:replication initiator n=1 Tax=Nonomuraea dietziae TaxID=65515 RepID=UPI003CD0679A